MEIRTTSRVEFSSGNSRQVTEYTTEYSSDEECEIDYDESLQEHINFHKPFVKEAHG